MSGGKACKCDERLVHLGSPRGRNWVVYARERNYSSFVGGYYTPSAYSCVKCLTCGAVWRTRANYVAELEDARK